MRVKSGISNVITKQCNNKSDCSIMWCLLLLESRNHARYPIIAQSSILQQSTNNLQSTSCWYLPSVSSAITSFVVYFFVRFMI